MTLARKLLRLISLDLPSEVLLQSLTFSKFGEEIESAVKLFRTVFYISVGHLNLLKIDNIFTISMNVIYKI